MFDFTSFEQAFYRHTRDALLTCFSDRPDHHFYAAAFHHLELEQAVPPLLGFQCIEDLSNCPEPEPWDCASWPDVPAVTNWLDEQIQHLLKLHEDQTSSKWKSSVKRLEKVMIAVCKQLTEELKRCRNNLTPDFAVLMVDDDLRLTPRCVTKAHLMRLFPHLDEPSRRAEQNARQPVETQIEIHLNALASNDSLTASDADRALRKIGPIAANAVAESLSADPDGWRKAMLLDHFCVRSTQVINALKQMVKRARRTSGWPANTLATLGEYAFLLERSELSDEQLSRAFLHPLSSWRCRQLNPLPLDYAPIENLIRARPATEHLMLCQMERASFGDIKTSDVSIALAGTQHAFAGIRRHAAYVLGRKGLGKANGRLIVAALLPLLSDANGWVRYNTICTLNTWAALPNDPGLLDILANGFSGETTS